MIINKELYNKWLNEKYVVATRTQEKIDNMPFDTSFFVKRKVYEETK